MLHRILFLILISCFLNSPLDSQASGCGCGGGHGGSGSGGGSGGGSDGGNGDGSDGGSDGGNDGGSDGGNDGGSDGGSDGGNDGGSDGGNDGGSDGGNDGGSDGGNDGGSDGGNDGGSDDEGDDSDTGDSGVSNEGGSGGQETRSNGESGRSLDFLKPRAFSNGIRTAGELEERLGEIQSFCGGIIDPVYLIDCIAERLSALEKDLARLPDHQPVRRILRQASRDLRKIAVTHRDPARPRVSVRTASGGQRTHRPIIAVAPEKLAVAIPQALAVLEDAQTKLLRSAENSPTRSIVRYQQIASAIDSSKVLLRSV